MVARSHSFRLDIGIIENINVGVAKLVDAHALGACAARHMGSSPILDTKIEFDYCSVSGS